MKQISIILCSCNRAENLRKTLESLELQLPVDDSHIEIIVVDNASKDHTPEVIAEFAARRPCFVHVHEPTPGKSVALNRAGRESTGEIMVWIDDDVIPKPGWLDAVTRPLIEGPCTAVVGRVSLAPYLSRDWMTPDLRDRLAEIPSSDGVWFFTGSNMAATRALYNKTQGYDENLGPGGKGLGLQDDSLMGIHLQQVGARIHNAEDGEVEHHLQVDRLKRKSWMRMAGTLGRSSAYVTHHWYHTTVPYAGLKKFRKKIQFMFWNWRNRPNTDPESEGITSAEMSFMQTIAYLDQYQIESRKPRNYEKEQLPKKA